VKCIRSKPSVFPAGQVPGSKSVYDDFIAVHLNQTLTIHLTVRGERRRLEIEQEGDI
jgi:tyrosinase